MKFKIILVLILLNPLLVLARGQDRNSFGGLENEDPFKDINKKSASRADRKKAEDIMAQLGYGSSAKPAKKDKPSNTRNAK